ncbi:MAG TPA: ACP phosphodiesterase [Gammaproteobacteria bacterium]
MNYLAHFHLASGSADLQLGGWLGDFVKGRLEEAAYRPGVVAGIRLHRRLDSCTDAHPAFRRSRARCGPALRRYAGILVDLFYDHLLARGWREHVGGDLGEFNRAVYRLLAAEAEGLPPRARQVAAAMTHDDWLGAYREPAGLRRALAGMARRLRRPVPLADGYACLRADYAGFEADFRELLPDLVRVARSHGATPGGGGG